MATDVAQVEIETTPCLLCGETAHAPLMRTCDRLCRLPGKFELVRCVACGLVYLSPRPTVESIGRYYPDGYDPFITTRLEDLPLLKRLSVRYGLLKRCRLVGSYRQSGRLLDVGCATGLFLTEMRRRPGWQVMGVEPGASAAEFARATYGLDVYSGDLPSARYPDAFFDVVTMWDVLEHLHAPVSVLGEVRRILRDDGLLILRTPSLDSFDARLFGPYWAGLDSPRHLALYSRCTAGRLLERAGFSPTRISTGSGSFLHCSLSFGFWLDAAVSLPLVKGGLLALARGWPARFALALPLMLTDSLGLGSEMMIVARPVNPLPTRRTTHYDRDMASTDPLVG